MTNHMAVKKSVGTNEQLDNGKQKDGNNSNNKLNRGIYSMVQYLI